MNKLSLGWKVEENVKFKNCTFSISDKLSFVRLSILTAVCLAAIEIYNLDQDNYNRKVAFCERTVKKKLEIKHFLEISLPTKNFFNRYPTNFLDI